MLHFVNNVHTEVAAMFKQIVTLVRGRSHEAGQELVDRNALAILRQQIRDSAESVSTARRAVAIAIAQNEQESTHLKRLIERIGDLEERAVAGIDKGETGLAREAADTIALLENERSSSEAAQESFVAEIDRLKQVVRSSETRLVELRRGERLAAATERTQRLRQSGSDSRISGLRDAEETLARLRMRQLQLDAADAAMTEMEQSGDPAALSRKLAEAGCGAPLATTGEAVLERLKKRAASRA
jgi:phage shock protein A